VQPPAIEQTGNGFRIIGPASMVVDVEWTGVRRATAFKRDLHTSDEIVLVLELDSPAPPLVELTERSPGFDELFGGMERALGVSPEWYVEIMLPVFEPTPRVLFERGER
jgi:hypothetical protein